MAIAGMGGSVYLDTNKVAEIKSWSLDLGADDIETTSFDSAGWKEYLAGLKEWSGSFEGNFEPTDTTGQVALINAWVNGTSVTLDLKIDATKKFSGSAFVKPSIEMPVDDKGGFSCDFQGTGQLTVTLT
ncbi:MAG: hypothetical protein JRD89_04080 [Deltaproteobacteria bacterium]|nr:hypothetical protein [Deltaproteobacteria bacterium]